MLINEDLTSPVIVDTTKLDWVPSPAKGVDRRMLFRIGGEVARATSIVRYAPGSVFPRHVHGGGEEILVVDGTFQDEHGDYPAGSYFRNPPGTSHIPAAEDGCTILVRLWQFREGDSEQIVRRPGEGEATRPRDGASKTLILFADDHEDVRLETWNANGRVSVSNERGLEFYVVRGSFDMHGKQAATGTWGRLPAGTNLGAMVGSDGAEVWLKLAPLLHPDVLKMPD